MLRAPSAVSVPLITRHHTLSQYNTQQAPTLGARCRPLSQYRTSAASVGRYEPIGSAIPYASTGHRVA
eukprot:233749-Rhodomonas_salina.1